MTRERLPGEHPWRRYLRLWKSDVATDVNEELRFHLESAAEEHLAHGLPPSEARELALKQFGDIKTISKTLHHLGHERERHVERKEWLDSVLQDARFAVRQLVANPGFTAVAVLTLALGIGATSAIFSVVNSVLLRPLPYAHSERLLNLREGNGPAGNGGMVVTAGNFAVWQERVKSFEALGAYTGDRARTLTGAGDPLSLRILRASASYWHAMYIPPVAGHYFTERDDQPGAEPVVVLSTALWRLRFAGDSNVVGKRILLAGVPHTVVGVAPPEYAMTPAATQSATVWLPLALSAADKQEHADHELTVVGLVRAGVSDAAAIAELTGVETELAKQYPNSYFDGGIVATRLQDTVVGDVRKILLILLGAVSLVLLIACTNVANLLLARAAVRQKELAIRSALGGARSRIFRQLMLESVVLAGIGAACGLAIAVVGVKFLVRSAPASIPRLQDVRLDGAMILFTLLLAVVSAMIFGILPALRASRTDLRGALNEGGRDGAGAARYAVRAALVVAQVSVALVLLIGAGLLLKSVQSEQNVPPGFEPNNVLVGSIALPPARYESNESVAATFARIQSAVAAIPGVTSTAFISRIPIGNGGMDCAVQPEGSDAAERSAGANQRMVTPGLFATLGIPMLAGRDIAASDVATGPKVVIINRTLARRLYGTDNAVGKRLTSCGGKDSAPIYRTVVGVIGDIHSNGLRDQAPNEVYYPLPQFVERSLSLVVRGTVPVSSLTSSLRKAINDVDELLPISGVNTMSDIISRSIAVPRFTTLLLGLLGGFGLVLAIVGIYGVIAYFVVQRTREIGVRIALGARPVGVLRLVVGQGLSLVAAGVAIGLGAAWLSAGVVESQLFGVSAHDPLIFSSVAITLVVVAVLASAVPAWRAARVDPLVAMRS